MNLDTIARLDAMFDQFPMMRAGDLPSVTEVDMAEQEIGMRFPADYREFLIRYGGAMVGPYPIFGLRPVDVMDSMLWSVVDVTRYFRKQGLAGPKQWAVISMDHAGNPIGFDSSGRISIIDQRFEEPSEVADTFEAYLRTNCLKVVEDDIS